MIDGMHNAMTTTVVKSKESTYARLDSSNQAGMPEFVMKKESRTLGLFKFVGCRRYQCGH